ncbi:MAG TPA: hypothetical protein VFZ56_06285 [Gemmatimonadaceae bacterium]
MGQGLAKWLLLIVVAAVLLFLVWKCIDDQDPPPDVAQACPHTWLLHDDTLELAVVGPKTNIPEFHDCQRFINPGGQNYGPLAAIFRADESLGQRFDPVPATGPVGAIRQEDALAAAVIYMIDSTYERLRLARGFNCLYLWGPLNDLQGTVVSVGLDEANCKRPLGVVPPQQQRRLPVNMTRIAGEEDYTREDIPAVARWDWDGRHDYFMSLSCGDFWCEIGSPDPGFQNAGPFKTKPAVRYATTPGAPRNNRIARVNGWYDEQHLASPVAGPPTPTSGRGTVFPHPALGEYGVGSFRNTWQPVAFVAVEPAAEGYRQKFGWQPLGAPMTAPLAVANLGAALNTISFCLGEREDCAGATAVPVTPDCPATGEAWFARSQGPTQSTLPANPVYKCVKYRPHVHGFDIPAVTRWRWREDDETLWIRCPQGCCEYEPT